MREPTSQPVGRPKRTAPRRPRRDSSKLTMPTPPRAAHRSPVAGSILVMSEAAIHSAYWSPTGTGGESKAKPAFTLRIKGA